MVLFLPLFFFHLDHPTIAKAERQAMMTDKIKITVVVEAKTKVCVLLYIFICF
jgi:hypothetical protein